MRSCHSMPPWCCPRPWAPPPFAPNQAAGCGSGGIPAASRCVRILMRVNGLGLYSRFVCFVKWLPWALVAVGALMGCADPSGRPWGFDAPTLQHIGKAAVQAATSPTVWGPTAGALVFTIDDWDEKVSAWAVKNTEDVSQVLMCYSHECLCNRLPPT